MFLQLFNLHHEKHHEKVYCPLEMQLPLVEGLGFAIPNYPRPCHCSRLTARMAWSLLHLVSSIDRMAWSPLHLVSSIELVWFPDSRDGVDWK
jgi:hypothetical protein